MRWDNPTLTGRRGNGQSLRRLGCVADETKGIRVVTTTARRERLRGEGGAQRLVTGAAGLHDRREPVLGDQDSHQQDSHQEVDSLPQGSVRAEITRQEPWPGFGTGLDLVAVHGDDQVGRGREVLVDRA